MFDRKHRRRTRYDRANDIHFVDGRISAPHFIFIKCARHYPDSELLQKLGIDSYQKLEPRQRADTCLYLTGDSEWVHLIDDWRYTLWYMPDFRSKLAELATCHDIFSCSVGEADMSYDFTYYKDGVLARDFVVEDPDYSGRLIVKKDLGNHLEMEKEGMNYKDPIVIVLSLACSLGITLDHQKLPIRRYGSGASTACPSLFDRVKRQLANLFFGPRL